jgi:hypothetical protein
MAKLPQWLHEPEFNRWYVKWTALDFVRAPLFLLAMWAYQHFAATFGNLVSGIPGFLLACLLVLVVAIILAVKPKSNVVTEVVTGKSDTELRLSMGRITANFKPLKEAGYVLFSITVFPCPHGLKLEGQLSGKVHYKERLFLLNGSSELSEQAILDTPQLDPDSGFANHGLEGTWITLRQHIFMTLQTKILEALNRPDSALEFHFDELFIMVSSGTAHPSEPQRLPLWSGVSCQHGVSFHPILTMTIHETIHANIV